MDKRSRERIYTGTQSSVMKGWELMLLITQCACDCAGPACAVRACAAFEDFSHNFISLGV